MGLNPNDKDTAMKSPRIRQNKKHSERWWLKYEAAGAHDDEVLPRELFLEFADSAYEAWLKSGKTAAQIEADIEHHIAVQKTFKKWREVYGDKI
jgi:hypothetical protein